MHTAAQIRRTVTVGEQLDVTNHYLTRPDHPCYGTRRVTVTSVNPTSLGLDDDRVRWPRAAQLQLDADGTIRFYGGGASQQPDELFLTLRPVTT